MGFSCSFLHNQTYTADDVNQAFARLTTQGVSLFSDTGDTLTDLNTAVSNMIENGVELFNNDACKVVKISDGVYQVMPGTAFMPNGEAITVDAEGYSFAAITGTEWNVVMYVSANAGHIQAQTEAVPVNGILIATIAADGTVTDTRTFAKTKVTPATANIVREITIVMPSLSGSEVYTKVIDLGSAMFENVVFLSWNSDNLYTRPNVITLANGASTESIEVMEDSGTAFWCVLTKNANILNVSITKTNAEGAVFSEGDEIKFIVF